MEKRRIPILLFLIAALSLLMGCERITKPVEEEEEPPVNKLLEVIEEDNIWGGRVITEVDRVMSLLRSTKYTLTNYVVNVDGGYLAVDCSKYVEAILKEVSLAHYSEIPKSSSSGLTSLAKDYYNHFSSLPLQENGTGSWIRIEKIEDARPGDIISYIHDVEGATTGHVMIICSYPVISNYSPADYCLLINDAANSGHFEDTRNNEGIYTEDYSYMAYLHFDNGEIKYSGVGIGNMWFHFGDNSYYRWSSADGNQVNKRIAIGRMVDIPAN